MALIELACHSRDCAPPPVGKGGSDGVGGGIVTTVVDVGGVEDQRTKTEMLVAAEVKAPEGAVVFAQDADVKSQIRKGKKIHVEAPQRTFGLDRDDLSKTVKALRADENWAEVRMGRSRWEYGEMLTGRVVGELASATQAAFKAAGVTHVVLYRGVTGEGNPFDRSSSEWAKGPGRSVREGASSGITSWTTDPNVAARYGKTVVKALVPVEHILSFDLVGRIVTRPDGIVSNEPPTPIMEVNATGREVLVSGDASVVARLAKGPEPKVQPKAEGTQAEREDALLKLLGMTSSGVIELACHSASCAPPPVGRGGSDGGKSGGAAYRILSDAAADPTAYAKSAEVPGVPEGAKVYDGTEPVRVREVVGWAGRGTISSVVKGEDMHLSEKNAESVKDIVLASHEALRDAGYTHVVLYRGVHSPDTDPFARGSSMMQTENGVSSGVTSWTTDAEVAMGYGHWVAKAVVPIDQIVSFDLVGARKTAAGGLTPDDGKHPVTGQEVLVAADPKIVSGLTASVALCAACHSAACAPPPVGHGGSEGGAGHGIKVTVIGPDDPLPPATDIGASYGDLMPQPGDLSPKAERALDSNRNDFVPPNPNDTVWDKWVINRGIDRADFIGAMLGQAGAGNHELAKFAVRSTQDALAKSGVKTVTLFRGVSAAGRSGSSDVLREAVPGASGITSWTTDPAVARQFSADGSVHVAEVPVSQILTWDNVGRQMTARTTTKADSPAPGAEVLVTTDPHAVERMLADQIPATGRVPKNVSADGSLCAACYEKSCAPPPVGTGGSSGGDGKRIGGRVRSVLNELAEAQQRGASADTLEDIQYRAETLFAARQQALGWASMGQNLGEDLQRVQDEFDALSEVLRPAEGFVRMGTPEAKAVMDRVKAVYPNAEIHQFSDMHPGTVDKVLEAAAKFPPEVRAKVGRVVLGFTEKPTDLAAVGSYPESRRMGINGNGGTILWLSERAVSPSQARISDRFQQSESTVHAAYKLVGPEERHGVVIAHEMAHVIHGMALVAEGRSAGSLESDALVPDIVTTKYGATNKAETVAESFALAKAKGFANITPEQQSLINETLSRAGLDAPADAMVGAASAEIEEEFWDEFFIGDDFLTEGVTPEMLEFACHGKVCAPPPVGRGGSIKGGPSGYHMAVAAEQWEDMKPAGGGDPVGDAVAVAREAGLRHHEMFMEWDQGTEFNLTEKDRTQLAAVIEVGKAVDAEVERRMAADPKVAKAQETVDKFRETEARHEANDHWLRSVEYAMAEEAVAAAGLKLTVATVGRGRDKMEVVRIIDPNSPASQWRFTPTDASATGPRKLRLYGDKFGEPLEPRTIEVTQHTQAWNKARAQVRDATVAEMRPLRIGYGMASDTLKEARGRITAEVLAGGGPAGSVRVYDDGQHLRATSLEPDLQRAAAFFPKSLTDRLGPVVLTAGGATAGSYNEDGAVISVSTQRDLGVFVHEFTHHIEYEIPDVSRASWAFLTYRTKGEDTRQMYSLMPGAGFKRGELGFRDKFNDPYSGRIYDEPITGGSINRNFAGREILTTATDNIFAGPRRATRKIDDEQRQFTLGILALVSRP